MDEEVVIKAETNFLSSGLNCAESVMRGVLDGLNIEYNPLILSVAHAMGGGYAGKGCICGALNGGAMVIGYINQLNGNEQNTGFMAKTIYERFTQKHGCACCRVLKSKCKVAGSDARVHCAGLVRDVALDVVELLRK